jgi:hypothetical protein
MLQQFIILVPEEGANQQNSLDRKITCIRIQLSSQRD